MTTKTKIALATAALVAVIAAIPLQIQSHANTRLQGELEVAQKQAATLKAGERKLETQLADQSLELQVLRAEQKSSLAAGAGTDPSIAAARPVVNPRAPSPGVYPANRPTGNDLIAAASTNGGAGMMEIQIRMQYGNLFQKMQFTPGQIDAFVKILLDQQQQENAILMQNPIDPQMVAAMRTMSLDQKQAILDQHDKQLQQLDQAVEQNTTAQLQPLLGSADNVDYYNAYTDQNKERTIITAGYAGQLASAGVPPLTVDQEEQVVNLVYQYRTALNGTGIGGNPVPPDQQAQILQQAGTFLSPDQVTILQKVMPSLVAPLHKSVMGG